MKITKEGIEKLWAQVKLNRVRLLSCKGPHKFTIDITPEKTIGKKWKCELCDGEIDSINKEWYELGLKHSQ